MPAVSEDPRPILLGSLVRPAFENTFLVLFPMPRNFLDEDDFYISSDASRLWQRNDVAVVVARQGRWLKVLVPSGGVGWISDWNVYLV